MFSRIISSLTSLPVKRFLHKVVLDGYLFNFSKFSLFLVTIVISPTTVLSTLIFVHECFTRHLKDNRINLINILKGTDKLWWIIPRLSHRKYYFSNFSLFLVTIVISLTTVLSSLIFVHECFTRGTIYNIVTLIQLIKLHSD